MMDQEEFATAAQMRYAKVISAFVKRPVPDPPYRTLVHNFITENEEEFKEEREKRRIRMSKKNYYKKMFNNPNCKPPKIRR